MTIQLTQDRRIAGSIIAAGTQQTLDPALEADLVQQGFATWVVKPDQSGGSGNVTFTKTLTGRIKTSAGDASILADSSLGLSVPNTMVLLGDSMTALNYLFYTISSASISGGVLTINTSADCNGYNGCGFRLANISDSAGNRIDGDFVCTARLSTTQYTCAAPAGAVDGACITSSSKLYNTNCFADSGPVTWGNIFANQKFDVIGLVAGHGWKVSEILSRVPEVVAKAPYYCTVLAGSNDYSLINSQITLDAKLPAIKLGITSIYKALVNAGIHVLAFTTPPMASPAYNAYSAAAIIEGNKVIRDFARNNSSVTLIDAYAAIVDPVSASKGSAKTANLQTDGLHWSAAGAFAVGKTFKLATDYLPNFDNRIVSNADNLMFNPSSTNLLDSAPWAPTGGTVSAPVTNTSAAADWSYFRSGTITVAEATSPARADGFGYDAKLTGTPTASGDRLNLATTSGVPTARITPGMVLQSDVSISATGVSGSNISSIRVASTTTIDGVSILCSAGLAASGQTQPTEDWTGVVRSPRFVINGALNALLPLSVVAWFTGVGSSLGIAAGRASIRKF